MEVQVDFVLVDSFDQVQLHDGDVKDDGIDLCVVGCIVVVGVAKICSIIVVIQAERTDEK